MLVLLLLCLMTGCGGDLSLSLGMQADPQQLRVRPATATYDGTRDWFERWSRVSIGFTNLNSTQSHRIILVQGDPSQSAAQRRAAAAQRPDVAPPADPAVLSAAPLVPPRPNDGFSTYDCSFAPLEPGQYV